jgi:hypothetical protein
LFLNIAIFSKLEQPYTEKLVSTTVNLTRNTFSTTTFPKGRCRKKEIAYEGYKDAMNKKKSYFKYDKLFIYDIEYISTSKTHGQA